VSPRLHSRLSAARRSDRVSLPALRSSAASVASAAAAAASLASVSSQSVQSIQSVSSASEAVNAAASATGFAGLGLQNFMGYLGGYCTPVYQVDTWGGSTYYTSGALGLRRSDDLLTALTASCRDQYDLCDVNIWIRDGLCVDQYYRCTAQATAQVAGISIAAQSAVSTA